MGKSEDIPVKKFVTLTVPVRVTCEIPAEMDPHEVYEELIWDVYADEASIEVSVVDVNGYSVNEV